jgi:hypothetical protein
VKNPSNFQPFRHVFFGLWLFALAAMPVAGAGSAWIHQVSGTSVPLRAVTWTGLHWIAVGDSGTILRSSDAVHWLPEPSGVSTSLLAVAGVDSLAAIAGAVASSGSVLDPDGMGDVFPEATLLIRRNSTGWTKSIMGGSTALYSMTFKGTGPWVTTGNIVLKTSTNQGSNWLPGTFAHSNLYAAAYSPTLWVTVGFTSTGGVTMIQTSTDARTWTQVAAPSGIKGALYSVAWVDGLFIAAGSTYKGSGTDSGTKILLTSQSGGTWVPRSYGAQNVLNGVTGVAGRFVAVGSQGAIVTSTDGISWSPEESATQKHLRGIATDGVRFVAVGDGGTILTWKQGEMQDSGFLVRSLPKARSGARAILTQASGRLHVRVPGFDAGRVLQAKVYGTSGTKVALARGSQGDDGLFIPLAGLGIGIYWLEVRGEGLSEMISFVITR